MKEKLNTAVMEPEVESKEKVKKKKRKHGSKEDDLIIKKLKCKDSPDDVVIHPGDDNCQRIVSDEKMKKRKKKKETADSDDIPVVPSKRKKKKTHSKPKEEVLMKEPPENVFDKPQTLSKTESVSLQEEKENGLKYEKSLISKPHQQSVGQEKKKESRRKESRNEKRKQKSADKNSLKVFESLLREDTTPVDAVELDESPPEGKMEDDGHEKNEKKLSVKKVKKEKLKKENEEESKLPSAKDQALVYLDKWKNDRKNWSFKKVRQVWLIKHMYNPSMVDDKRFSCLLEYLAGAQGHARKQLIEKAESLFALASETEKNTLDDNNNTVVQTDKDLELNRARKVLQIVFE